MGRFKRQSCSAAFCLKNLLGSLKNSAIAAELHRNHQDGGKHDDVDHHVFRKRNHRRRPQAARVGVKSEYQKCDNQRNISVAQAETGDHDLNTDELKSDVGHGCN